MKEKYTSLMAKAAIVIALITVVLELTHSISARVCTGLLVTAFLLWALCTYIDGTYKKKGDKSGWLQTRRNAFKKK